jgi:hypothetical protein
MSCLLEAKTKGNLDAIKSGLLYSDLKKITVNSTDYFYQNLKGEVSSSLEGSLSGNLNASISHSLQASTKFLLPARFCHPNVTLCGSSFEFNGGVTYPSTFELDFGAQIGTVTIDFSAFTIPDRCIIYYNGNVVVDSKYRGSSNYNTIGGGSRNNFTSALSTQVDPITGNSYPDFTNPDHLSDGYPEVFSNTDYTFEKNYPFISTAILKVYGPIDGTAWNINISCPVP